MESTVIIYGAGNQGRTARNILESQGLSLTAFADRDEAKVAASEWEGAKVISLNQLRSMDRNTPIILGIGAHKVDILRQIDNMLTDWGFSRIFWSTVEFLEQAHPSKGSQPIMHGIEFTTNVGCSANCKWCAQKLFVSRYAERLRNTPPDLPKDYMMSFETFKKCIDKVPLCASANFAGYTEPFLNPQTTDMILYAAGQGRDVVLYTTLLGFNEEILDRLKNINFSFIVPHLPDADGNAKIPVTDEYLRLLIKFWKTFEFAISSSGNQWRGRISHHGKVHPQVAEALLKEGIDLSQYMNISCRATPIAGNVITEDPLPSNKSVLCGIMSVAENFAAAQSVYRNKDDIRFAENCFYLTQIVLPNGDVTICNRDYGLTFIIGNLLQGDYNSLHKGNPLLEKIRSAQRDPLADILCRTCECAINMDQIYLVARETHL